MAENELDFTSSCFNPLKALYAKDLQPPVPNVQIFNTINEYAISLKMGKPVPRKGIHDVKRSGENNSLAQRLKNIADNKTRSRNRDPSRLAHLMKVKSKTDGIEEKVAMLEKTKRKPRQKNVLEKMEDLYKEGPLSILYNCIEKKRQLKVWTRRLRGLRGVCVGYLVAFDKHMNLAMMDVDEMFAIEEEVEFDPMTTQRVEKKKEKKRNWRRKKRELLRLRNNSESNEKDEKYYNKDIQTIGATGEILGSENIVKAYEVVHHSICDEDQVFEFSLSMPDVPTLRTIISDDALNRDPFQIKTKKDNVVGDQESSKKVLFSGSTGDTDIMDEGTGFLSDKPFSSEDTRTVTKNISDFHDVSDDTDIKIGKNDVDTLKYKPPQKFTGHEECAGSDDEGTPSDHDGKTSCVDSSSDEEGKLQIWEDYHDCGADGKITTAPDVCLKESLKKQEQTTNNETGSGLQGNSSEDKATTKYDIEMNTKETMALEQKQSTGNIGDGNFGCSGSRTEVETHDVEMKIEEKRVLEQQTVSNIIVEDENLQISGVGFDNEIKTTAQGTQMEQGKLIQEVTLLEELPEKISLEISVVVQKTFGLSEAKDPSTSQELEGTQVEVKHSENVDLEKVLAEEELPLGMTSDNAEKYSRLSEEEPSTSQELEGTQVEAKHSENVDFEKVLAEVDLPLGMTSDSPDNAEKYSRLSEEDPSTSQELEGTQVEVKHSENVDFEKVLAEEELPLRMTSDSPDDAEKYSRLSEEEPSSSQELEGTQVEEKHSENVDMGDVLSEELPLGMTSGICTPHNVEKHSCPSNEKDQSTSQQLQGAQVEMKHSDNVNLENVLSETLCTNVQIESPRTPEVGNKASSSFKVQETSAETIEVFETNKSMKSNRISEVITEKEEGELSSTEDEACVIFGEQAKGGVVSEGKHVECLQTGKEEGELSSTDDEAQGKNVKCIKTVKEVDCSVNEKDETTGEERSREKLKKKAVDCAKVPVKERDGSAKLQGKESVIGASDVRHKTSRQRDKSAGKEERGYPKSDSKASVKKEKLKQSIEVGVKKAHEKRERPQHERRNVDRNNEAEKEVSTKRRNQTELFVKDAKVDKARRNEVNKRDNASSSSSLKISKTTKPEKRARTSSLSTCKPVDKNRSELSKKGERTPDMLLHRVKRGQNECYERGSRGLQQERSAPSKKDQRGGNVQTLTKKSLSIKDEKGERKEEMREERKEDKTEERKSSPLKGEKKKEHKVVKKEERKEERKERREEKNEGIKEIGGQGFQSLAKRPSTSKSSEKCKVNEPLVNTSSKKNNEKKSKSMESGVERISAKKEGNTDNEKRNLKSIISKSSSSQTKKLDNEKGRKTESSKMNVCGVEERKGRNSLLKKTLSSNTDGEKRNSKSSNSKSFPSQTRLDNEKGRKTESVVTKVSSSKTNVCGVVECKERDSLLKKTSSSKQEGNDSGKTRLTVKKSTKVRANDDVKSKEMGSQKSNTPNKEGNNGGKGRKKETTVKKEDNEMALLGNKPSLKKNEHGRHVSGNDSPSQTRKERSEVEIKIDSKTNSQKDSKIKHSNEDHRKSGECDRTTKEGEKTSRNQRRQTNVSNEKSRLNDAKDDKKRVDEKKKGFKETEKKGMDATGCKSVDGKERNKEMRKTGIKARVSEKRPQSIQESRVKVSGKRLRDSDSPTRPCKIRKVVSNSEKCPSMLKTKEAKLPGKVVTVRVLKVDRGKALVLKRRHVNQLFIRGDNVIMVAYQNDGCVEK